MPSKLEKEIEYNVCKYARSKGFLTPKLNVIGERGWPDRLLIDPDGWHVYFEFKKTGESLDPIQEYRIGQLTTRGCAVLVVDDEKEGKEIVDALVAARVPEKSHESLVVTGVRRAVAGPRSGEN